MASASVPTGFYEKYNIIITKLLQTELNHFRDLKEDSERIKLLYPYLQSINLDVTTPGKSKENALKYKVSGNRLYQERNCEKAIENYNNGIIVCPQNDTESREILATLIANRSACLFDLKKYDSALKDIDYALSIKAYPQKLHYKLFIRQAKCHQLWKSTTDVILDSYNMALLQLTFSEMCQKDLRLTTTKILTAIDELKSIKSSNSCSKSKVCNSLDKSCTIYKYVHEAVSFNYQPTLGRFAVALENIPINTILIDEPAHCAVLITDFYSTNCHNCMLATDSPIACDLCCNVVFCSLKCMEAAALYHRFECGFLKSLTESGTSINCQMALRIVTQQTLTTLNELSYNSNSIYGLCRNENQRNIEGTFHYTIMAIFLLRLLKTSSYFGVQCSDHFLTDDEILITKYICRNLEILEFNAHEISELKEELPENLNDTGNENCKAVYIGGGLYPTAALFNHSCDPSVIRYNVGSRIVVKTIKPIAKHDTIFENYGPIYTNKNRDARRLFLLERYWFTCECQPCTEDWPLYNQMKDDMVKIRCTSKNCTGGINMQDAFNRYACCRCNKTINVLAHLKALSELDVILPKAEAIYNEKKFQEAAKLYIAAMNLYYKHTIPPFPDWVKVQQRLRTCMVNDGNKSIQYHQKHLK